MAALADLLPPNLTQVGDLLWMPSAGLGSRGGLEVTLKSNHKSVELAFKRTSRYLEQIPRSVFLPASRDALALAVRYSSGTGKPPGFYSRHRPAAIDDYVINVKSGTLRAGWRLRSHKGSKRALQVALYNVARSGGFNYPLALFTGTVRMRSRPLPQRVHEEIGVELDRLIKLHSMRLLRKWRSGGRGKMEA